MDGAGNNDSNKRENQVRWGTLKFTNSIVEDINVSFFYWEAPPDKVIEKGVKPVFDRNTTLILLDRYNEMVGKYLEK